MEKNDFELHGKVDLNVVFFIISPDYFDMIPMFELYPYITDIIF